VLQQLARRADGGRVLLRLALSLTFPVKETGQQIDEASEGM